MKKTITFFVSILLANNCLAQIISNEPLKPAQAGKTLYIVKLNDGSTLKTRDLIISFNDVKSEEGEVVPPGKIQQYTDDQTITAVIVFKIKSGVNLLNLDQVFNKYHIKDQYRSYNILSDNSPVVDRKNVWFSESQIGEIIIYPNQHYLNIRANNYQNFMKLKEASEAQRLKNIEIYKKEHPVKQ